MPARERCVIEHGEQTMFENAVRGTAVTQGAGESKEAWCGNVFLVEGAQDEGEQRVQGGGRCIENNVGRQR